MDYADASGINLSDMGSFGGGGGKDGGMQPPEFGMDRKQGPNASGFTPEMQPPSFDMDAFPDDPGGDFSGSQFPSRENDTEAAMDTQMIDPDNSEKNGSEEVSPDFEREEMPDNIQGAFPTPGNGHGNGDRMMTSDGMYPRSVMVEWFHPSILTELLSREEGAKRSAAPALNTNRRGRTPHISGQVIIP